MSHIKLWDTESTKFRIIKGSIDDVIEKIHVDFVSKCRDPRHSEQVTDKITNLIKSNAIVETIGRGFIRRQLIDFCETNKQEQTLDMNTFSVVEAANASRPVLTVTWRFSLTDKLYFGLFYGGGKDHWSNIFTV